MNKLVMVPESLYAGMLRANEFKDYENIDYTKKKLEKIRKNRRLGASTRNVLHNQEFRRFLKMRNEEKNRPVKVELANSGVKILAPPNGQPLALDSEGELLPVGKEELRVEEEEEEVGSTPDASSSLSVAENSDISEQLYQHIITNKNVFGISKDDGVYNNPGKDLQLIRNSNLKKITDALVEGRTKLPAGAQKIIARGADDIEFQHLIEKSKSLKKFPKESARLQPNKW